MPEYCVNRNAQQATGDHEVHDLASTLGCLPDPENRVALGTHKSCAEAVKQAKTIYDDVDGCALCSPDCHTS